MGALTLVEEQNLCQDFISGKKINEIIKKYKITSLNMYLVMANQGLDVINPAHTSPFEEKICQDYLTKMTLKEIAVKYSMNIAAIYKVLKNNHLTGIRKISSQELEELLVDYRNGMPIKEMEKKYQVSGTTIGNKQNKKQKICREFKLGKPINKLANKYKMDFYRIKKILELSNIRKKRAKTEEDIAREKQLCEDYQQGMSSADLEEKYNISRTTVYNLFKKYNIAKRGQIKTEEDIKREERDRQLCEDYQQGMLFPDLVDKYGVSQTTISNKLLKYKIAKRGRSAELRHTINEDFFANPLVNKEPIFIYGFLFNYVSFHKGQLAIRSTDENFLIFLNTLMQSSYPIIKTNGGYCYIHIGNKRFIDNLFNSGFSADLGQRSIGFDWKDEELAKCFLQGFLARITPDHKGYQVSFTIKDYPWRNTVIEMIKHHLNIVPSKINKDEVIFYSKKEQVHTLINWVFGGLEPKFFIEGQQQQINLFIEKSSGVSSTRPYRITPEVRNNIYNYYFSENKTFSEIARIVGLTSPSVRYYINKMKE